MPYVPTTGTREHPHDRDGSPDPALAVFSGDPSSNKGGGGELASPLSHSRNL